MSRLWFAIIAFAAFAAVHGCEGAECGESKPTMVTVWELALDDQPMQAVVLAEHLLEQQVITLSEFLQVYALTGDGKGADDMLSHYQSKNPTRIKGESPIETGPPEPAIAAIVDAARSKRIVMLNESHRHQRHRAFALLLAKELRKIGYDYLGAETFSPTIVDSMADGAPDGESGVYTVDPLFGDFIRQASILGYQLFPYEHRPGQSQGMSREQAQAENIRKVLEADPDAKVFIYAGGSHIMEEPDRGGREWMALKLKRLTGLDPLTIDQTAGTPGASPDFDPPLYRRAVTTRLTRESVIRGSDGEILSRIGSDMTVFHPRAEMSGLVRPDWLSMDGYRDSYVINLKPSMERRLIRAISTDAPSGSVAMDQILVQPKARKVELMLPPGEYRLEAHGETGSIEILTRLSADGIRAHVE